MNNRKNYFLTFLSNAGSIGLTSILGLVSLPISINYWGVERFGVWSLLTSFVVYLSVFNFGLDSACSVLMAKNPAIRDKMLIFRRTITLGGTSAIFGLLAFFFVDHLFPNWVSSIGLFSSVHLNEASLALTVLVISYLANLPFSMVSAAYSGFQRVYLEKLFSALFAVLGFGVLVATVSLRLDMVEYAVGYALATFFVNVLRSLIFFLVVYVPHRSEEDRTATSDPSNESDWSSILNIAGRLFAAGLAGLAIYFSDNLIITAFLGAAAVASYVVSNRLYQLMLQFGFLITIPLASLIGREAGRANIAWIAGTFNRTSALILWLAGAFWLGGVLFLGDIIAIWIGQTGLTDFKVIVVLGLVAFLTAIGNVNQVFLNSLNLTKGTQYLSVIEASLKIGLALALIPTFGVTGLALGGALGLLIVEVIVLSYLLYVRTDKKIRWNMRSATPQVFGVLLPSIILGCLTQTLLDGFYLRFSISLGIVTGYVVSSYLVQSSEIKLELKLLLHSSLGRLSKAVTTHRKH